MTDRKYKNRGGIYPVMGDNGKQARDKSGRLKWLVQVHTSAFDASSGKVEPKTLTRRVAGSKKDAEAVLDELKKEVASSLDISTRDITLNEFADRWESYLALSGCRDKTVRWCMTLVGHVLGRIGHLKMRDIDKVLMTDVFSSLMNDKSLNQGRGLSRTTLHSCLKQTRRLFEFAVDCDVVLKNPCRGLTIRRNESERKSLKPTEYGELFRYLNEREEEEISLLFAKESRMENRGKSEQRSYVVGISGLSGLLATRIALDTGCRRGEALGLTWSDVTFGRDPKISIRRSLTPEMEIKSPKTRSSVRTIAISPETEQHLAKMRRIQSAYITSVLGRDITEDDPVCCSDVGGWLNPNNFGHWWREFRTDAGFPDLKFHELRHTQASLLLDAGVPIEEVRERLGHASLATTSEYTHNVSDDAGRNAANTMRKLAKTATNEGEKRFYAFSA